MTTDHTTERYNAMTTRALEAEQAVENWKKTAAQHLSERDRLQAALQEIRNSYGKVCSGFELCTHPACASSYGAWATADMALNLSAESET